MFTRRRNARDDERAYARSSTACWPLTRGTTVRTPRARATVRVTPKAFRRVFPTGPNTTTVTPGERVPNGFPPGVGVVVDARCIDDALWAKHVRVPSNRFEYAARDVYGRDVVIWTTLVDNISERRLNGINNVCVCARQTHSRRPCGTYASYGCSD